LCCSRSIRRDMLLEIGPSGVWRNVQSCEPHCDHSKSIHDVGGGVIASAYIWAVRRWRLALGCVATRRARAISAWRYLSRVQRRRHLLYTTSCGGSAARVGYRAGGARVRGHALPFSPGRCLIASVCELRVSNAATVVSVRILTRWCAFRYMRTETGCSVLSSFESMTGTLDESDWSMHSDPMHERNCMCPFVPSKTRPGPRVQVYL
jgi:hypothetical protein